MTRPMNGHMNGSGKAVRPGRVLVAGGAGFLGSHLCERLLADGHEVLCVDNLATGSLRNVRHLLDNRRFVLLRHDIVEPLAELVSAEVDAIYNLACPASPVHYQMDPVQTVKTSVVGGLNLLELARRSGARILQASTSEVYGDPLEHPQGEGYWGNVNPIGPRACYDEGKRCAETLFFDYHRRHGVPIRVARIFNTYGPRMHPDDGRIVANFVLQALRGEPLTVYGDGRQTRAFCYVADMVEGLVRLMGAPDDLIGPVNLGNPAELPVLELARRVIRQSRSRSEVAFRPLPVDDPRRRRPDISRARDRLGWTPGTPLRTGLARTIAHFRARLAEGEAAPAPVAAARDRTAEAGPEPVHP